MQKEARRAPQFTRAVQPFYGVAEVARMLDLEYWALEYQLRTKRWGKEVPAYRWVDAKYARISIPLKGVNFLRSQLRGQGPLPNWVPDKDRYDRREVATIIGLKWRRMYQLTDLLKQEAGFYEIENHSIGMAELRGKFGKLAVERAEINALHYVSVEEAADKLGYPRDWMWDMIESGEVDAHIPTSAPIKVVVDKPDLLTWIDSKIGAYDSRPV